MLLYAVLTLTDTIKADDAKSLAAVKAADRVKTKFDDVMANSNDMDVRVKAAENRVIPTTEEYHIARDPMAAMDALLNPEPEKPKPPFAACAGQPRRDIGSRRSGHPETGFYSAPPHDHEEPIL